MPTVPPLSGLFDLANVSLSGQFNLVSSPVSGQFNLFLPVCGQFNVGTTPLSGQFDLASVRSGQFNLASSPMSGLFDVFATASSTYFGGSPMADVTMPASYQGFFQTGHEGDMWCEFDFAFTSTWRQDGQAFVVGGSVLFDNVASINLLFSDVGGCQITWTPLFTSTLGSQPGLFQSATTPHAGIAPNPIYTSADWNCGEPGSNVGFITHYDSRGNPTSTDNFASITLYNGSGNLDTTSVALTDGTVYSVSGTLRLTISAAEYKNNQHSSGVAGEGELVGVLTYAAFAFPGATVSYELKNINCAWGETPYIGDQWFYTGAHSAGEKVNGYYVPHYDYRNRSTDIQSASFGVAQQNFLKSDVVNTFVGGVYVYDNPDDQTILSTDYQGNDPQRDFTGAYLYPPHTPTVPTCKATVGVMGTPAGYGYTYATQPTPPAAQNPNLVATGQRHLQMTISNVMFNSGPWAPLPYSGELYYSNTPGVPSSFTPTTAPSSTDLANVSVAGNSITSNFPFGVTGASSTSAHLYGNIYEGDNLATTDYDITFGNVSNTFNYNFTNTIIYNITNLTVHNGHIDTYVPQILSIYPAEWAHPRSGDNYKMIPSVPLDRNDYSTNSITLGKNVVVNPAYGVDATCWLLDDYAWPIVTVSHAASVVIEHWASLTGWTGSNATVSSSGGLKLVATGTPASVASPSAYGKDCRNYRFLDIALTSDTTGNLLVLINSNRSWTVPIVAGTQTVEIDLCNPSGAAASVTRTGYDTQPDTVYGVGWVASLALTIPNGAAVTFASLTLVRHASTAPGSGWCEATALSHNTAPEIEWYPPDIPVTGYACPPDPTYDPDSQIAALASTNHLYARQWQFRSDGRIAGDLPQAIQAYPFVDPITLQPLRVVKSADRQTVTQFAALVNAQPGLSCTAPADGSPGAGYPASGQYAVWLTLDNYITAAPFTTDCKSVALTCRQLFSGVKNYPGQFAHLEYAFLKRRYTVVQGLVVNPSGGSANNIRVDLVPCGTTPYPRQTVYTDATGYFRFPTAVVGLYIVSTNLASAVIQGRPRALRWVGLPGSPSSALTPCNYQDAWGRYHRAVANNGNLLYWRSDYGAPLPSWAVSAMQITYGGTDTNPRLAVDSDYWVWLVFARSGSGGGLYRTVSTDDGQTWSTPLLSIAGATKVDNATSRDGTDTYIEVGVVPVSGGYNLQAVLRQPGDAAFTRPYTLVDATGTALSVSNDTFGISQSQDGIWVLHVVIAGETSSSDWWSSDEDASTWTRY